MKPRLGTSFFAVSTLLLLLLALLVERSAAPPSPLLAEAPQAQFAVGRAWRDLAALADLGPRPLRPPSEPPAAAHQQAQTLLVQRMQQLGLAPEIQKGEVCAADGSCWQIENVVGRLDPQVTEPAKGGAILLLAHYDSVAAGPGAGDDAAGSATVLEMARALALRPQRRRPLIVVIDDGEERDLFGAKLFLRHRFAAEVALVLNFEARGVSGQTAMFETSRRSAWLIEAYGRTASRPLGSSLISELYQLLPNDTDLTVTKRAGRYGLNFAFADADWHYHTKRDNLEQLSPSSVQHMGDQGLAIAGWLLEQPSLPSLPPSDDDAVYFDLLSQKLVVYRRPVATALALLLGLLYVLGLGLALRRRLGRPIAHGVGRLLLVLLSSTVAGQLMQALIGHLGKRPLPWRTAPLPTFAAIVGAALLFGMGSQLLLDQRPLRRTETSTGAVDAAVGQLLATLGLLVAAALLLTWRLLGASYLFALPGLLLLLPLAAWLLLAPSRRRPELLWLGWLPGLLASALLWFTTLRVVRVMVGAQLPVAVSLPVAILLLLYEPLGRLYPQKLRWLIVGGAAATMLGAAAWAIATSGPA